MNNMNQMLRQAQKLQEEMMKAQSALESREFSASAGGDMAKATVNGKKELKSIELKPEVVKSGDREMIQDLVLSAVNSALQQATEAADNNLKGLAKGMNLPPGFPI